MVRPAHGGKSKHRRKAAIRGGVLCMLAPVTGLEVHRRQALVFFVLAAVLLAAARSLARRAVLWRYGPERALIIGSEGQSSLARKLKAHREYGVEAVGL